MRIIFVAPRFHTNQVEIVRALQKEGHCVRFLVSLIGHSEDHAILMPLVLEESRLSKFLRRWFGDGGVNQRRFYPALLSFYRIMQEFCPDVVIVRSHGFVFTYLAAFCARLLGSKVVFYQQVNPRVLMQLHRGGGRAFLRKINFHLPLFLFRASWMTPLPAPQNESVKLPRRCHFIPFAVPVDREPIRPNACLNFLIIGKYQPRKNQLLMLEAASKLSKCYDFRITFVGEVSTSEHSLMRANVESAAVRLGLSEKVIFLDNIPYRQMFALYRNHDVFVLPASNEPASVSILEALGQGLPVVCSDTCGTQTYIRDGIDGFVFSSDDPVSLKNILERFLSEPKLCLFMSAEALKAAQNCVSAKVFYQRFMAMLSDLKT